MLKKLICLFLILASIDAESFTLFSHRGARGLAPENTLPAIQKAIDLKVDAIDIDVVMSKDNKLMVYHDFTLNPDTTKDINGNWVKPQIPIIKLTEKQLKNYKISKIKRGSDYANIFPQQSSNIETNIPTLQEAIQYIKRHADYPVFLQIELKTIPSKSKNNTNYFKIANAINKLLTIENFTKNSKIQSFDWYCLQLIHQINPEITTGYLTSAENSRDMLSQDPKVAGLWTGGYLLKDHHNSIPEMIKAMGGIWWDAEDIEINQENINKAHKLGLLVSAWSWPEKTTNTDINIAMQKKLIEMKIDGIISDRPDITKKLQ